MKNYVREGIPSIIGYVDGTDYTPGQLLLYVSGVLDFRKFLGELGHIRVDQ